MAGAIFAGQKTAAVLCPLAFCSPRPPQKYTAHLPQTKAGQEDGIRCQIIMWTANVNVKWKANISLKWTAYISKVES